MLLFVLNISISSSPCSVNVDILFQYYGDGYNILSDVAKFGTNNNLGKRLFTLMMHCNDLNEGLLCIKTFGIDSIPAFQDLTNQPIRLMRIGYGNILLLTSGVDGAP